MQVVRIGLDLAKYVFEVHGNPFVPAHPRMRPAAIVGREGVVGGGVAIDGRNPNTQSTVQIEGSAWQIPTAIGLVPKQHSSGGREKLGSISKQGDRYLRSLFVTGAFAVIRYAKIHGTKHRPYHSLAGSASHQSRGDRTGQ